MREQMPSSANITVEASAGSGERTRRTPVQQRSRTRVEEILKAAEQLVVAHGADALTTRAVADAAQIPVGSLYAYFADRDAVIRALIERHVVAMDAQLVAALGGLQTISVRSLVQATVDAYVAGYAQRPSYVILWFQSSPSAELVDFVTRRSVDLADGFRAFSVNAGLVTADTEPIVFRFVAEMIDAFLRVAYRGDLTGDRRIVAEGVEMIVDYLERHATADVISGVPAAGVLQHLELGET
jgi:AcrR family transcriptional regulator